MDLTERKKRILRAIIESYIQSAEPVGSKAIAASIGMEVSSATIRNEMADLEAMGLLEKPHTSAGRIPSPKGYRFYVNELMEAHKLSLQETERMNQALRLKMQELDRVLDQAGRVRLKTSAMELVDLKPPEVKVKPIRDTVSSLRLDAVAAAGFSLSRGKAADLIASGRFQLNHRECLKPDRPVGSGDVMSCRGLGKCVLKEVGGPSKKGRIMILLERYV